MPLTCRLGCRCRRRICGSRLELSPYIADAIVVGSEQAQLICLLLIEQETVARHVREQKLVVTGICQSDPG